MNNIPNISAPGGNANIMLDLETMSTRNNAAVASIGAVAFDPSVVNTPDQLDPSEFFYVRVNLASQRGRDFDGDTIYWWLQQSESARRELPIDKIEPDAAVLKFRDWYISHKGGPTWSYGATFDNVVLQDLYNWLNRPNPISYRDQLCMRTVVKLTKVDCPDIPGLVIHNAIGDAVKQTIWLQRCLQKLRG